VRFLLNIVLYFSIALMVVENQIFIAALLAAWFTFRVGAVWLLPLAFLLDGYFGAFFDTPYISLITGIWYVASEYIRPRLIVQKNTYEKTA
jgi:hypothetical protein